MKTKVNTRIIERRDGGWFEVQYFDGFVWQPFRTAKSFYDIESAKEWLKGDKLGMYEKVVWESE